MRGCNVRRSFTCAFAALLLSAVPMAQAQFLGRTVEVAHLYPNTSSQFTGAGLPVNLVAGTGIEIPDYGSGALAMDIADTSISLLIFAGLNALPGDGGPNSFDGFRFADASGAIPDIVGASVGSATDMPGFGASRLSFDANHVYIDLEGLSAGPSSRSVVIDVLFASAPVPEPGSLPLFVLGLFGMGLFSGRSHHLACRPHKRRVAPLA
jgi:hypothetical protein